MSDLTRRRFVRDSAGAAAGLTAIGALTATRADAHATTQTQDAGSDPVVAYVKNPSSGEISILAGEHEITVHDRALAARIARAAR